MRLYLNGDLFYTQNVQSGYNQIPHCGKEHNDLLNLVMKKGVRGEDSRGVYYDVVEKDMKD